MKEPIAIVLVRDDPILGRFLGLLCETAGLRPRAASTVPEALLMARSERPLLILLDVEQEDESRLEVIRELRADPATTAAPIIALTTIPQGETGGSDAVSGSLDFVEKPLVVERLLDRLREYARSRP